MRVSAFSQTRFAIISLVSLSLSEAPPRRAHSLWRNVIK